MTITVDQHIQVDEAVERISAAQAGAVEKNGRGTVVLGSVITPSCQVQNYGSFAATFPVRMRIGSGYEQVVTVTDLAAGAKFPQARSHARFVDPQHAVRPSLGEMALDRRLIEVKTGDRELTPEQEVLDLKISDYLVEVDAGENMKLAGHYRVRGFPTVIIFLDGEEVARFASAKPTHWITEWI